MNDPTNFNILVGLAERAKYLVKTIVLLITCTSHDSCWNQLVVVYGKHDIGDPSKVRKEAPNHAAYFITAMFDGTNSAGTCYNIRSGIRYHCKHCLKYLTGGRRIILK